MSKYEVWVDEVIPKHERLTDAVISIMENLLKTSGVEFLAVTGRTKSKDSCIEKINRKSYKDPVTELTDLSGIRIVAYFESDIKIISDIINEAFNVDAKNSLNQDERLSIDQIGYRSVHFVCDIGGTRSELPEFKGLSNLKFEVQVRTVLQHAWAELAHDRNYKFSGKLPSEIERSLFLYAGMLEIADKGFSELSERIDGYIFKVQKAINEGDLDYELDSLTLPSFIENWFRVNNLQLKPVEHKNDIGKLIYELNSVGITRAIELNDIIPENYAKKCEDPKYFSNIWGHVRNWLIIHDWRKLVDKAQIDWVLYGDELIELYFDEEEYGEIKRVIGYEEEIDPNCF